MAKFIINSSKGTPLEHLDQRQFYLLVYLANKKIHNLFTDNGYDKLVHKLV